MALRLSRQRIPDLDHPRCTHRAADLTAIANQEPPYLPRHGG